MNEGHVSVLYKQSLDALLLENGKTIVDGTLGGAGHSEGILRQISPGGMLIGIDKDDAAIKRCGLRLSEFENKMLVKDDFKNINEILNRLSIDKVDGVLLDLGVSSYQLDEGDRGFSYKQEAPLDMRMDRESGLSAQDVVNEYSKEQLTQIIKDYGEERWASRIAQFIVERRKEEPIETTFQLVGAIKAAIPKAARAVGAHPAKKTFQAIRIEVNGELKGLKDAITDYIDRLNSGGRIAIITFHSLEDRAVKQTFQKLYNPCECPKEFPVCVCNKKRSIEIITRKPILPTAEETEENRRARSAKLRVAEKL